jgi:hypothetical protein
MVSVARGILNGAIGIVAGAREIASMRFGSTAEYDEDVLVFVGIDSESDHLPVGDVRRHWSPEALRAKDAELRTYEAHVKKSAFRACDCIIARYG